MPTCVDNFISKRTMKIVDLFTDRTVPALKFKFLAGRYTFISLYMYTANTTR